MTSGKRAQTRQWPLPSGNCAIYKISALIMHRRNNNYHYALCRTNLQWRWVYTVGQWQLFWFFYSSSAMSMSSSAVWRYTEIYANICRSSKGYDTFQCGINHLQANSFAVHDCALQPGWECICYTSSCLPILMLKYIHLKECIIV